MRAFLGGRGLPREEFALSGVDGADGSTPVILLMENGEVFTPADYISLGFTHFEAWCVGAAGGQGGGAVLYATFDTVKERQVMPSDLWAIYCGVIDPSGYNYPFLVSGYGWDDPNKVVVNNNDEFYSWYNPTHEFNVYICSNPRLVASPQLQIAGGGGGSVIPSIPDSAGGGAGGGGVHVVSGALADLDVSVDIAVGVVGDNSELGHTRSNGPWTPMPWEVFTGIIDTILQAATGSAKLALNEFFYQYPEPHTTFYPPQVGEDGETSSFGDICKASGGKGGHPAKIWSGSAFVIDGDGGDGGIGDHDISGGGGVGSLTPGVRGADGAWDADAGVGKGGGGGHGGAGGVSAATSSGKGSFSYSDTSIYGAQQAPTALIPGNGGGVRALRKYPYGARVPKYDPDGAVILRIYKID